MQGQQMPLEWGPYSQGLLSPLAVWLRERLRAVASVPAQLGLEETLLASWGLEAR